jgi:8-oxo-dGTP pyrophosphatase MutT (NUDIX family)
MDPVRHSVRALLFDGEELVLFRRDKAGREPYWITPGGGIEKTDASPEAALRRELEEELGATAGPVVPVFSLVEPGYRSTVFVARLVEMDLSRRNGHEFRNPADSGHEIQRIRPADVGTVNFVPEELREFVIDNAAVLPALVDARRRYRPVVDVHVLLFDGDRVLLGLRRNTGYADGEWGAMPSGHLDEGESVIDAGAREAREELGIEVGELDVVHVMHHRNPGCASRIGFYLVARSWSGTPVNAEPDKCEKIAWFPVSELPANTLPAVVAGIQAQAVGADSEFSGDEIQSANGNRTQSRFFSLHGWERPGLAELRDEAARSKCAELTVAILAAVDGGVLMISDAESDRLPSTIVRPGESLEQAIARLHPGPPSYAGAADYVSPTGVTGRRFVFAVTPRPDSLPKGLRMPARDRALIEAW